MTLKGNHDWLYHVMSASVRRQFDFIKVLRVLIWQLAVDIPYPISLKYSSSLFLHWTIQPQTFNKPLHTFTCHFAS